MKIHSSINFLLFFWCLGLLFSNLTIPKVEAQTCDCIVMDSATRGFPQGQEVKVLIDPAITGLRRDNVEQAFKNWEAARFENNSQVTYTFVTSRPSANEFSIIVNSGQIADGSRGEAVSPVDINGYTLQATITLDSRTGTTNFAAVLDVMAHEISHPMGFDNSQCFRSESVTGPGPARRGDYWNVLSGKPTSPTGCDNQKLKTSNYTNVRCINPADEFECSTIGGRWSSISCTCETLYPGGGTGGGGIYPEPSGSCPFGTVRHYWVEYVSYDNGRTWQQVGIATDAGCLSPGSGGGGVINL